MSKESNKSIYGQRPAEPFIPSENIPDLVNVPDKTIYVLTEDPQFNNLPFELIEPLAGQKGRDWFTDHFYFCLPITFGNQHGFIVRLMHDVVVRWDGRKDIESLKVHLLETTPEQQEQIISSHFGSGILTIQNRWTYRTPKGVNMLVTQPPNFPIKGIMHMSAVVETDQLRRDFTFNLKVTTPNQDFYIPKGTPIGCVLPYPRHFIDNYQIILHPPGEVFANERKVMQDFGKARSNYDAETPGLLYMKGVDVYGNKFAEHQKSLPITADVVHKENELVITGSDKLKNKEPRLKNKIKKGLDIDALRKATFPHIDSDSFNLLLSYALDRIQENLTNQEIIDLLFYAGWDKKHLIKLFEKLDARAAKNEQITDLKTTLAASQETEYLNKFEMISNAEAVRLSVAPHLDSESFRKLLSYVLDRLNEGYRDQEVIEMLVNGGWSKELSIKLLKELNGS